MSPRDKRARTFSVLRFFLLMGLLFPGAPAQTGQEKNEAAKKAGGPKPEAVPEKEHPFADLSSRSKSEDAPKEPERSWREAFFTENFGFRKEIMSQFSTNEDGHLASRQSLGFEVLKKFSTATQTVASFNMQGRLVRRDGFHPVLNDMEGENRPDWAFEYHNLYLDFYNVLNPLLSVEQSGRSLGRFRALCSRTSHSSPRLR
jgi:hypothetical protein